MILCDWMIDSHEKKRPFEKYPDHEMDGTVLPRPSARYPSHWVQVVDNTVATAGRIERILEDCRTPCAKRHYL